MRPVKCLDELDRSQIDEVRVMMCPPEGVRLTMEAVCILLQVPPRIEKSPDPPYQKVKNYWKAAKEDLLSSAQLLLNRLKNFDRDHVPREIMETIQPYTVKESFTPEVISRASMACVAMCKWVLAMYKYGTVNREVEPKRQRLRVAQGKNEASTVLIEQAKHCIMQSALFSPMHALIQFSVCCLFVISLILSFSLFLSLSVSRSQSN